MAVVAVLIGGRSPEHDISLISGRQVLAQMSSRWSPLPVWIDRDGQWWPAAAAGAPADIESPLPWDGMRAMSPAAALAHLIESCSVEAVFPVLHGPDGEDGRVQGMLELHDLPCVGSGCAASAVAMDKVRTRECLQAHGVAMPRGLVADDTTDVLDASRFADEVASEIGFPTFLKLDRSGSSIGVARVEDSAGVVAFVEANREHRCRLLAEALVEGEEITVGVLGNAGCDPEPLPPVGIYPVSDEFFNYDAKYDAARCEEIVPPRGLNDAAIAEVQALGLRCHEALRCDGMSRVDMMVGRDGPVVLEVNTIPGFTPVSLLPKAAAAAGLDYSALIDRLLDLALARQLPAERVL